MKAERPSRYPAAFAGGACALAMAIVLAAAAPRAQADPNKTSGDTSPHARAPAADAGAGTRARVELAAFEWLAGAWVIDDGNQHVEEVWTRPAADLMLGMSRTLVDGRTAAFEFMRIAARADGVFYIAQPRGKPPVEFPLQSWDGAAAVFVNDGSSDHLKRIVYRRDGAGLTASIEGTNGGREFTETYAYRRPAAPTPSDAGR